MFLLFFILITIYYKTLYMTIFSKNSLQLKETTYKKKNVVLKEVGSITPQNLQNVTLNNFNQTGTTTLDLNSSDNEPNMATSTYTVGDKDGYNQAINQIANQANAYRKSDPSTPVLGQLKCVPQTSDTKKNDSSGDVQELSENLIFTKKEMNNFLRNL